MRIVIIFLCTSLIAHSAYSQTPKKTASKNDMQNMMSQMTSGLNKQIADLEKKIADAKKNKADAETIKGMEDELAALKKQVAMLGGMNKQVRNMSAKTFQKASEENSKSIVPAKDVARIRTISKKILTDAELLTYLKTVFADVERIIPPVDKAEARKIYNETKGEYNSANALNSAASGCWMYGHQGKALWITGRACIDYQANPDLLDNYAAFLTMTGAEQYAIPVLLYLDNKYPNNSTVLNNLGQAWFGLGDILNSKKYLEHAAELYPTHSMANLTLSKIYLAENPANTTKAMAALKNSIKESYSADKESLIESMGVELTIDDLPDFNYPVEKDPFHFDGFFQLIPDNQGSVDEYADSQARWEGFENAMAEACKKAKTEAEETNKERYDFIKKMTEDIPYQRKILSAYQNSPAHLLAKRYLVAIAIEDASAASLYQFKRLPFPVSMTMPSNFSPRDQNKPLSEARILKILDKFTEDELIKPCEQLGVDRNNRIRSINTEDEVLKCQQVDAINTEFLTKVAALQKNYKNRFYQKYLELKSPFDKYISITGYAEQTKTVADPDPAEAVANYFIMVAQPSNKKLIGKPPYMHRQLFSGFINQWRALVEHRETADGCRNSSQQKPAIPIQVPQTKQPECPNIATINLSIIKMAFEWGRMLFDESKLKKLTTGETKGSAVSSNRQPSNSPVSLDAILNGRGPSMDNSELKGDVLFNGPLITGIPDAVDITQRYVEFDKFGNFSDFRIPLNEDGTGFADTESPERFDQRRWCWIACPSEREKILAGLLK